MSNPDPMNDPENERQDDDLRRMEEDARRLEEEGNQLLKEEIQFKHDEEYLELMAHRKKVNQAWDDWVKQGDTK